MTDTDLHPGEIIEIVGTVADIFVMKVVAPYPGYSAEPADCFILMKRVWV